MSKTAGVTFPLPPGLGSADRRAGQRGRFGCNAAAMLHGGEDSDVATRRILVVQEVSQPFRVANAKHSPTRLFTKGNDLPVIAQSDASSQLVRWPRVRADRRYWAIDSVRQLL